MEANIETRESTRARVSAALGLDLTSALDIVSRGDYDSEDEFLDACVRMELERSSPEYRAARSRLKAEYRARQEKQERAAQTARYREIRSNVGLDDLDRRNIDEQAADLARRDLAAGRISASALGKSIEGYAAELSEKRKSERASSILFNSMLRGQR